MLGSTVSRLIRPSNSNPTEVTSVCEAVVLRNMLSATFANGGNQQCKRFIAAGLAVPSLICPAWEISTSGSVTLYPMDSSEWMYCKPLVTCRRVNLGRSRSNFYLYLEADCSQLRLDQGSGDAPPNLLQRDMYVFVYNCNNVVPKIEVLDIYDIGMIRSPQCLQLHGLCLLLPLQGHDVEVAVHPMGYRTRTSLVFFEDGTIPSPRAATPHALGAPVTEPALRRLRYRRDSGAIGKERIGVYRKGDWRRSG